MSAQNNTPANGSVAPASMQNALLKMGAQLSDFATEVRELKAMVQELGGNLGAAGASRTTAEIDVAAFWRARRRRVMVLWAAAVLAPLLVLGAWLVVSAPGGKRAQVADPASPRMRPTLQGSGVAGEPKRANLASEALPALGEQDLPSSKTSAPKLGAKSRSATPQLGPRTLAADELAGRGNDEHDALITASARKPRERRPAKLSSAQPTPASASDEPVMGNPSSLSPREKIARETSGGSPILE